jgi:hypothetical protein
MSDKSNVSKTDAFQVEIQCHYCGRAEYRGGPLTRFTISMEAYKEIVCRCGRSAWIVVIWGSTNEDKHTRARGAHQR